MPLNDNLTIYKLYSVPVFGGNYWIIDLAEDYSWVVIGEPCRTYYWVMSREKTMDQECLAERLRNLRRLGFCTKRTVFRSETCKEDALEN